MEPDVNKAILYEQKHFADESVIDSLIKDDHTEETEADMVQISDTTV